MFKHMDTNLINIIIIIGALLFVVEITLFNGGLIFTALFSGLLIYLGWKNFSQLWGKICFWFGMIIILLSILNMMAIRFFVIVGIALFLVHYFKSKNKIQEIKPEISLSGQQVDSGETVYTIESLFDRSFFQDQKTSEDPYSWRDVNIHGLYGDRMIDLSNTILPNDTSVISIRHLIGNIIIYIPYGVEVSIHHSSIFGRATILNHEHCQLFNQTVTFQTGNYNSASPRVKVITSLFSGDIEVKRI